MREEESEKREGGRGERGRKGGGGEVENRKKMRIQVGYMLVTLNYLTVRVCGIRTCCASLSATCRTLNKVIA